MKRFPIVAAVFLLSVVCTAQAATGVARARLDAFATGLHSLTGSFTQTLVDPNGNAGRTSSGTLALEAPRQFRWETTAPYKQTIVADGSRVWMYDPELEQVQHARDRVLAAGVEHDNSVVIRQHWRRL